MRWDDLFADLEAQADVLDSARRAAEVEDRVRLELGGITLADRLRAGVGLRLRLRVSGGLALAGTLERVGPDWLLLAEDTAREAVVSLPALSGVVGLDRWSRPAEGVAAARLGLRSALRGIARDRSAVQLHLVDGDTVDATIDRVGADFAELARHAPGEPRRRGEVREVVLVPVAAIAAVRRAVG